MLERVNEPTGIYPIENLIVDYDSIRFWVPSKPGARRLGKARGAKFSIIIRLKVYADKLLLIYYKIYINI